MWQEVGTQEHIETPGKNQKSYAFGAFNPQDRKVIHKIYEHKRSCEFIEFLKILLSSFIVSKIYLVLDNFSIHKTKAVKRFLEEHKDRLELVFLPTYSPHLNLIEDVWRIMRRYILKNKLYPSMDELKKAIDNYFYELNLNVSNRSKSVEKRVA